MRLLSPDLAAGIRRVKGAKRLGVRLGNWLTVEQGKKLLAAHSGKELRDLRNRAVLAMLLGMSACSYDMLEPVRRYGTEGSMDYSS